MKRNAVLLLVTVIVCFAVAEFTVRVSGIWVESDWGNRNFFAHSTIDEVPYLLKPNIGFTWSKSFIKSNSAGLRNDRDFEAAHDGVIRILAIGDSFTFGYGVDQDESYPYFLERYLNDGPNDRRYEVINAGIDGFNAVNAAYLLRNLASRYKPDIVAWLLTTNDYDDSMSVN